MVFNHIILFTVALLLIGACTVQNEEPKMVEQDHILKVVAPSWKEGDEWQYSDGYGLRVTSVKGNVTTFQRTDDPKQWVSRYGFLREEAQSHDAFRKVVYRSVPPSRGLQLSADNGLVFTREYLADKKLMVHRTSWVVEGRETITVPAGKFDCLIIVMRTRSLRSGWHGFERWWYSPKLKHYARIEYKYGSGPISSRVLVSYVAPLTDKHAINFIPAPAKLEKSTAVQAKQVPAKPEKSTTAEAKQVPVKPEKLATAEAKPAKSILATKKLEKSTTAEAKPAKSILATKKLEKSTTAEAKPAKSILATKRLQKTKSVEAKIAKSTSPPAKPPKSKSVEAKPVKSAKLHSVKLTKQKMDQTGHGNYFVQLGLFEDPKNVQRIYAKLKKRGIVVVSERVRRDGKHYDKLRIGPYYRKNKANDMADSVNSLLGIRSLVLYKVASK